MLENDPIKLRRRIDQLEREVFEQSMQLFIAQSREADARAAMVRAYRTILDQIAEVERTLPLGDRARTYAVATLQAVKIAFKEPK